MDKLFSSMSETAQVSVVSIVVTLAAVVVGPYVFRLICRLFSPQQQSAAPPPPNSSKNVTGNDNQYLHAGRDAVGRDKNNTEHHHGTTNVTASGQGSTAGRDVQGVTKINHFKN